MSEDNSDLTVRILQRIQTELVGLREDYRGVREDNRGIHAELAGLREETRDGLHEVRDEIHGLGVRIDGVLHLVGSHHEALARRVSTVEARVDALEAR